MFSEVVNDGVVAASSVLLIGSFFWVGAGLLAVACLKFTEISLLIISRKFSVVTSRHNCNLESRRIWAKERFMRRGV